MCQLFITVFFEGGVIGVTPRKAGFRNIHVPGKAFLVDGVTIKLRGMNHHDYNPKNDQVVSHGEIEEDIHLMEQFNINAIQTSRCPTSTYFYDLCSEYGTYVIDGTDLKCHGFELTGEYDWTSNDPE